jgi:hypothetical protein
LVIVRVIEYVSDAAKTASNATVSWVCRRCTAPRATIAITATSNGQTTKNCTWMDSDQKCCTTLVVLLRAA